MSVEDTDSPGARLQDRSVFEWLQTRVKPAVDARIRETIRTRQYGDRLWYPIGTGGKRWRPGLTLLAGRLCGVPEDRLLDVGAGIELLHNFTLIHDDVMDGDERRRGEPSMWVEYDEPTAITMGDMMFAQSVALFPDPAKDAVLEATIRLAAGQQMDHGFEDRRDVTVDEYLEMVRKKTGALLELALEVPELLAGTTLGIDGYASLGPAFQIRDDILDFEPGKGRTVGADVREGKRTLLAIHADDERVYDVLDKPPDATTVADVREVRDVYRDAGSMAFAEEVMRDLAHEALDALDALPESSERAKLRELGQFLVERDL